MTALLKERKSFVVLCVALLISFPVLATASEDEMMSALILDDEGVVINVAVYHPVDSAGWLEAMEARGAQIIINEQNTVGIGSVLQEDGSFVRDEIPTLPPASEPPDALPAPGDSQWQQHNAPESEPSRPRAPVIRDPELARHLGVTPSDADGNIEEKNRIRTALIIEDGVVVNAAVYHTIDSVGWLELMRKQGAEVLVVPEHSAGIGWIIHADGSVVPPPPRPGLVWNGTEWRAPGSEHVERPSNVRGWSISRSEELAPPVYENGQWVDPAPETLGPDPYAGVSGWLIVPDEALMGDSTHVEITERSIVMLESYGEAPPLLARFNGLTALGELSKGTAEDALQTHEATTGAPLDPEVRQGFIGAVRRITESFLRLMNTSAPIENRPLD